MRGREGKEKGRKEMGGCVIYLVRIEVVRIRVGGCADVGVEMIGRKASRIRRGCQEIDFDKSSRSEQRAIKRIATYFLIVE